MKSIDLFTAQELEKLIKKSQISTSIFLDKIKLVQYHFNRIDSDVKINKVFDPEDYVNMLYCNSVVRLVTIIETFLKQLIIEFNDRWLPQGISKLLTTKITIAEAFELTKVTNLKPSHLIAHSFTFVNIESLVGVFEKLTDKNIIDELVKEYPDVLGSDFKKQLTDLFKTRNQIVHEDNLHLEKSYVKSAYIITWHLVYLLTHYFYFNPAAKFQTDTQQD